MAKLKMQGTTLAVGAVGGPYNTFGQITGVPDVSKGGTASENDTTDLSSTGKDFVPGLKGLTEVTIPFFYDPDDTYHEEVSTAFDNQTKKGFQITLTDSTPTVITTNAYVTDFKYGGAVDEMLMGSFTIKYGAADFSKA